MSTIKGEVITFYSYKGGTGRTMALANLANLLIKNGKKVLVIDWDLESPGLHQYLRIELSSTVGEPGLIELFTDLNDQVDILRNDGKDLKTIENIDSIFATIEPEKYILSYKLKVDDNILPSNTRVFFFLKTGRFDNEYSHKVNSFQWVELFQKAPLLFQRFAIYLSQKYEYVLIDSRTGICDSASVCTTLMPDKLVFVFVANHQNLTESIDLLEQVKKNREQSDDPRELIIYPLPSRIDLSENKLRQEWRKGYQQVFEDLFENIYHEPCNLQVYFDLVQIQHVPYLSYGEEVAILQEDVTDRLSIASSYQYLMEEILNSSKPWNKSVDQTHETDIKAFNYMRLDQNLGRVSDWRSEQYKILSEVKDKQNELKKDIDKLSEYSKILLKETDRYYRNKFLKRFATMAGVLILGFAIYQWRSTDANIAILVRCQQEQTKDGDCPNRVKALKALIDRNVSLQKFNFSNAKLEDVDLSGANFRNADFTDAKLSNANLSSTDLSGVDFSRADLRSTNISEAKLSNAKLFNADLSTAKLNSADLRRADLSQADLNNATLLNANLESANLTTLTTADTALIKLKTACNWQKADLNKSVKEELRRLPDPQEKVDCSIWIK